MNRFWGPDIVYFTLHADGGGVPGEVLDSAASSGTVTPGTLGPPMVVDFGGDVGLEPGKAYWPAARTEQTGALLSWAFNAVDDFGLRAWRLNKGPWNPAEGIPGTDSERDVPRINGTPVFEVLERITRQIATDVGGPEDTLSPERQPGRTNG